MKHYLAVTIGPIFATLQQARKTRELWAASYLFSQLMEFLREEISAKPIAGQVLLPHKLEAEEAIEKFGAGIYNDRLFAELDFNPGPPAIEAAIDRAVDRLAIKLTPKDVLPDATYWRQMLRIEWACKPLNSLEGGELFTALNGLLDTAELFTPYFHSAPETDRLLQLLDKVYQTKLAKEALPNAKGQYDAIMELSNGLFPSTADFATFELYKHDETAYLSLLETILGATNEEEKQMDQLYETLYSKGNPFEGIATDYHKYFCIVHADGDNLSSLNGTLGNKEAYQNLSQKLSKFALKAAGIINDYGGKPVFIGGDDLLFFSPVCTRKDKKTVSVFQLIEALSSEYESLGLGQSALSFGLTITYHKFPLFEAHQLSYGQLAYRAKKVKWKNGGEKNAVAFRLLKHSGAYFEGIFSKTVLKSFIAAEQQIRGIDGDLLSGIVYKMDTLSSLLEHLQKGNDLGARLSTMFDNFFNEPVHQRNKDQMYLVQSLLNSIYKDSFSIKDEATDKNIYALLRLLKFVTDKPAAPKTTSPELQVLTLNH